MKIERIHTEFESNDLIWLGNLAVENATKKELRNQVLLFLKHFFKDDLLYLQHSEHGKPMLTTENGYSISVSYSRPYFVVYLNENFANVGIDVEQLNEKLVAAKHLFLSPKELIKFNELNEIQLCWSAKEALYKFFSEQMLIFKTDIEIQQICFQNHSVEILVYQSFLFQARFVCFDTFVCVWI